MLMLAAEAPRPEAQALVFHRAERFRDGASIALACLFSFALSWPHLVEVWRTGTFFDTDDAMRMVEVRDWLAGQGWFEMTAHRLAPPAGLLMHWSRIVDLPLGLLVRLFGSTLPPVFAERLARIVFPLLCQVSLILAFARTVRALCGRAALIPSLLVIVASGFEYGQFVAGRVDHHAPQIVLLVGMVGCAAAVLRRESPRAALGCAGCIALSLGISLENLPFIATVVAALVLAWLWRGERAGRALGRFGLSLAAFVLIVFTATVPPARYAVVANDALSAPHVLLACLGGVALFGVTRPGRWSDTPVYRGCVLLLSGCAVGAVVLALCPGFPADPYAAIDPVVKAVWLAHVTEAMPLGATIALHPAAATLILTPLLTGLGAAVWAAFAAPRKARAGWRLVAAVTAVGLAGAFWQVRVASSAMPLAMLGGAWAVTRAAQSWVTVPLLRVAGVRMALATLPFTPFAWVLVPVPDEDPALSRATAAAQDCRAAEALAPLAALPAGLAFAPIDIGSHLLAHTGASVLAAPYHRNNVGNRAVIDGLLAPPAQAESLVRATGARTVVVCPGEVQMAVLASTAPDGLASHLLRGDVPVWLTPIPLSGTTYRAFAVAP